MIKGKLNACMQRRNYSIATCNFLTIFNENATIYIIIIIIYYIFKNSALITVCETRVVNVNISCKNTVI